MNISIRSEATAKSLTIEVGGIDWASSQSEDFYQGEVKIQELVAAIGQELTKQLISSQEERAKVIEYEGEVYYQKAVPSVGHYKSLYGEIAVERHLYQTSQGGQTLCPLEMNCQFSFGSATPLLAELIGWKASSLTPREVALDFEKSHRLKLAASYVLETAQRVGAMAVEKKQHWDLQAEGAGTDPIRVIATGLDGTTMPLVGEAYKEAMVGTLALYNNAGQRVATEYLGAMPEPGKATFCRHFQTSVDRIRQQYPQAFHVCLADGAAFNWEFLGRTYPEAIHILDFYHASEHLAQTADWLFGPALSEEKQHWYEHWRSALKEQENGVSALIRSLLYKRNRSHYKAKAAKALDTQLNYFRNNAERMRYWQYTALGLPIGSGVTEAGCKELVKARFCRSGMKWKRATGNQILQLRAIKLSNQWDNFWFKVMRYVA